MEYTSKSCLVFNIYLLDLRHDMEKLHAEIRITLSFDFGNFKLNIKQYIIINQKIRQAVPNLTIITPNSRMCDPITNIIYMCSLLLLLDPFFLNLTPIHIKCMMHNILHTRNSDFSRIC